MSKFKKGDKVRCIDTNWKSDCPPSVLPVYQGIYTVKSPSDFFPNSIFLEEIPIKQNGCRQHFADFHFEKATEQNIETMIVAKEKLKELILN